MLTKVEFYEGAISGLEDEGVFSDDDQIIGWNGVSLTYGMFRRARAAIGQGVRCTK